MTGSGRIVRCSLGRRSLGGVDEQDTTRSDSVRKYHMGLMNSLSARRTFPRKNAVSPPMQIRAFMQTRASKPMSCNGPFERLLKEGFERRAKEFYTTHGLSHLL